MKKNLKVYWSSIEYIYTNNNSKNIKLKGGFVYCFVSARDAKDAIKKFELALNSMDIAIKSIDFVSTYDLDMEWETKEQTTNFINIFKTAEKTDKVIFDDFYAYQKE